MWLGGHTVTATASLATNARVSAQETTPGHSASNNAFTLSMKSKPRRVEFGMASFSAVLLLVELSSREPSQPCEIAV